MPITTVPRASELLAAAVAALTECENDSRYVIDMGAWHQPNRPLGVTHVSLAGAWLAKCAGLDPGIEYPFGSTYVWEWCACALLEFQTGAVHNGCMWLRQKGYTGSHHLTVCSYRVDAQRFKADMLEIAAGLKREGL